MSKNNIPYSDVDIESVLLQGEQRLADKQAAVEATKRDNLRGGNSGCIDILTGDIYGCHRSAIARALGMQESIDQHSRLFFDAGEGMETALKPKFKAGWDHTTLCEEEIPVKWETEAGHAVTGRPDFVLMKEDGTPHVGIELKTIVSYNGMKRVYMDHRPEAKHVIQSAHYMWQHDCPWVLTYVSPARYMASVYDFKKLPREAKGKFHPYRAHFYLKMVDGRVHYSFAGKEVETIITTKGINDYYDIIKECMDTKQLLFHPVSKYIDGKDMPYHHHDYCTYCKKAEEVGGDYEAWVEGLKDV